MSRKQEGPNQQTCGKCPEPQGTCRNEAQEIAQIDILYILYSMHHVASPCGSSQSLREIWHPASVAWIRFFLIAVQKKATVIT